MDHNEELFDKVAGLVKAYTVATNRLHGDLSQFHSEHNVNRVTYEACQASRARQAEALAELAKVWDKMTRAEQDAYDAWYNEA